MSPAHEALPTALDGRHVLALPAGTDVVALASAWFREAAWLRPPETADEAAARTRPARGARFRGVAAEPAAPVPGLARLDDVLALEGPTPLAGPGAAAVGLPARTYDLYALVPAPDGSPGGTDPTLAGGTPAAAGTGTAGTGALRAGPSLDLAVGWFSAAARRAGGAILPADRSRLVVPDPASAVDLTLWSAQVLSPEDLLVLARRALTGARTTPVDPPAPADGEQGEPPATVVAAYEYDGAVRVSRSRSTDVPVVLAGLSWRDYGPWPYRVTWLPTQPEELEVEHPSQLHVIARARIAPAVARVTGALLRAVGGTVVDGGGFVVPPEELEARASTLGR